jgi:hypothetical protein
VVAHCCSGEIIFDAEKAWSEMAPAFFSCNPYKRYYNQAHLNINPWGRCPCLREEYQNRGGLEIV